MSVKIIKQGRPKGAKNKLTPASILNRVIKIMRSDGKIPSIRKLAADLKVDPMAIYYYYSSKNELLEAVTVSLVKEIYEPVKSDNWQKELKRLCKSYLRLLNEYPGLLEIVLSMKSTGPAEIFIQRFHIALSPIKIESAELINALDLLADYLHGFALAMSCNPDNETLNIDDADGPLDFFINALVNLQQFEKG